MTQTLNRDRFNQIAADWDDNPTRAGIALAVAEAIRRRVPLTTLRDALEYGCGTGLVTAQLAADLKRVLAVDLSPGMIDVLRGKLKDAALSNVEATVLDLTTQPAPTEHFDLVFSSMTLHHIPDVPELLQTFSILLNPGGWIALADLDAEDGSFHGGDVPGVEYHGFERSALEAHLTRAGFRDVHFETAHEVTRSGNSAERRYPIFLVTARRNA